MNQELPPSTSQSYDITAPEGIPELAGAAVISDEEKNRYQEPQISLPARSLNELLDEIPTESQYRQLLHEGYQPFAGEVARIKRALETTPPKEVSGYLAAGNEALVFATERDGKKYAIRISQIADPDHIESYVEAPRQGYKVPGIEQLVGFSRKDGATAAELIPGKSIDKYTTTEIAAIPTRHLEGLAATMISAAKRGIALDGNDGNLLYDPEAGFGFVDCGTTDTESSRGIAVPVSGALFHANYWLPNGQLPMSEHPEDYIILKTVVDDVAPAYDRWLQIVAATQQSLGLGEDFLTRQAELAETSRHFRSAQLVLGHEGAIDHLVETAHTVRLERVLKLRNTIEATSHAFMKATLAERLARIEQAPRLFPKGNRKVSRNDQR